MIPVPQFFHESPLQRPNPQVLSAVLRALRHIGVRHSVWHWLLAKRSSHRVVTGSMAGSHVSNPLDP